MDITILQNTIIKKREITSSLLTTSSWFMWSFFISHVCLELKPFKVSIRLVLELKSQYAVV